MNPIPSATIQAVEDATGPTALWGNVDHVVLAARESAPQAGLPYFEFKAAALSTEDVNVIFERALEMPAWHLFANFSSASPETKLALATAILMADHNRSVHMIASWDTTPDLDPPSLANGSTHIPVKPGKER